MTVYYDIILKTVSNVMKYLNVLYNTIITPHNGDSSSVKYVIMRMLADVVSYPKTYVEIFAQKGK